MFYTNNNFYNESYTDISDSNLMNSPNNEEIFLHSHTFDVSRAQWLLEEQNKARILLLNQIKIITDDNFEEEEENEILSRSKIFEILKNAEELFSRVNNLPTIFFDEFEKRKACYFKKIQIYTSREKNNLILNFDEESNHSSSVLNLSQSTNIYSEEDDILFFKEINKEKMT